MKQFTNQAKTCKYCGKDNKTQTGYRVTENKIIQAFECNFCNKVNIEIQ